MVSDVDVERLAAETANIKEAEDGAALQNNTTGEVGMQISGKLPKSPKFGDSSNSSVKVIDQVRWENVIFIQMSNALLSLAARTSLLIRKTNIS